MEKKRKESTVSKQTIYIVPKSTNESGCITAPGARQPINPQFFRFWPSILNFLQQ